MVTLIRSIRSLRECGLKRKINRRIGGLENRKIDIQFYVNCRIGSLEKYLVIRRVGGLEE